MRPRLTRLGHTVALVIVVLLIGGAAGELLVRAVSRRDADGQVWVRDLRLRPYRLPLTRIADTLAELERGDSFLDYDPDLGWAPRPLARSRDGLARAERAGIRADADVARAARAGVLRIAVFGDSFTFGEESALADTWGAALERTLAARGIPTEVLNFGVSAYGMDQAYLRWRKSGRQYEPAVVIYGFQPENVLRNLNVFRPVYFEGSEIPLSKPRFVLRDGTLTVVNVPTVPVRRLVPTLAALEESPLLAYEPFFAPLYVSRPWRESRAVALLATRLAAGAPDPFQVAPDTRALALAIVAAFADDVTASGGEFLIVHLPRRDDLVARSAHHRAWYEDLWRALAERHPVIDPELARGPIDDALFAPRGHYGPELNRRVAGALVEPLARRVAGEFPRPRVPAP